MKRIARNILTGIVISLLAASPAYAGEWVKGVSEDYPEAWSYAEEGRWVQNNYVIEGGEGLDTVAYYISPCGTMVTNNYAPNGVWIGEDGKLQYHKGNRITDISPKAAVYGWDNGHDYITYSFYYYDDYSDGFSIADVEAHITGAGMENGFFLQYNLVKIGNGCFALCSDDNMVFHYYLTVSEDGNKLYITASDGTTNIYSYLEELVYS